MSDFIFICRHLLFKQIECGFEYLVAFSVHAMVLNTSTRSGRGSQNYESEITTAERFEIGTENGSVAPTADDWYDEDSAVGTVDETYDEAYDETVEDTSQTMMEHLRHVGRWSANRVAEHQERQRVAELEDELSRENQAAADLRTSNWHVNRLTEFSPSLVDSPQRMGSSDAVAQNTVDSLNRRPKGSTSRSFEVVPDASVATTALPLFNLDGSPRQQLPVPPKPQIVTVLHLKL